MDAVSRKRFETKNRFGLILLDSNLEIGLKEFIVHREDLFPKKQFGDAAIKKLFFNRQDVIDAVTRHIPIDADVLTKARHYYEIRNKMIHERATVEVTDADIATYRATVEKILGSLFGLKFR